MDVRGALKAQNIEFVSGGVLARHGFKSVGSLGGPASPNTTATDIYSWYGPFSLTATAPGYSDQNLVWFSPTLSGGNPGFAIVNIATGLALVSGLGIINGTPGAVNASFVGVGLRLYMAAYDASQHGVGNAAVTSLRVVAGVLTTVASYNQPLFIGPMTYTPSAPTEPSAGSVTAGVHRYGYLLEFDSGFTTRVSPDSGAVTPPSISSFQPISFTSAGSKNVSFTLNPASWENGVVAVSMVMTTTTNLNQYYIVPGSRTTIATVADHPKTIAIDISDGDLASQAIDATPYLYWLTNQPDSGAAQFFPSHLSLWGDRMAYRAYVLDNKSNKVDCLYVSERNNYQAITADQHILQLPGQRPIVTMFRMGTSNYILGPHEIWAALDNGDVPVTWSAPYLIDGRHGTLAIHGVEVAPSGQYAWIADQSGLYLFAGSPITSLPVSYQQTPHWNRINWGAANCIKIKDDASSKKVYVMVPLDGATTPSHLMVFDYTDGAAWESVRYSLDSLSGYALGAMELVRNDLAAQATGNQKRIELWLGSSSSNPILRRTTDQDTTPFRDNGAAINSVYRTCPLPGRDQAGGVIQMHHGFHARLKGSGSITPVVYDTDSIRSFTCRTATLSTTPDADLLFAADLRGEVAAVEFNTNTLDTYWTLAYLRYYHSPYIMQR